MNRRLRIVLALVLAIIVLVGSRGLALKVSNPLINLEANAGSTKRFSFKVGIQEGRDPVKIETYLQSWTENDKGANIYLPNHGAKWFFRKSFEQEKEVRYKFKPVTDQDSFSLNFTAKSKRGYRLELESYMKKDTQEEVLTKENKAFSIEVKLVKEEDYFSALLTVTPKIELGGLELKKSSSVPIQVKGSSKDKTLHSTDRSATSWIDFSEGKVTLKAKDPKEIKGTIKVPEDAKGTYWSMVSIDRVVNSNSQVTSYASIGIPILITTHNSSRSGHISNFEVTKEEKQFKTKVKFVNDGDKVIDMGKIAESATDMGNIKKGDCFIRVVSGNTGKVVERVELPKFFVFPGHDKIVEEEFKLDLSSGKYLLLAITDYGGKQPVGARKTIEISPQESKN